MKLSAPWHRSLCNPLLVCAALCVVLAGPEAVAEDANFFNAKILPIFETHCFDCHSHEQKIKGGLSLDTRSGLTRGGEGGPVVVPGRFNQFALFLMRRLLPRNTAIRLMSSSTRGLSS